MKEKFILVIAIIAAGFATIEIKKRLDHYNEVRKFDQIEQILRKGSKIEGIRI